jgi:hypothetical protein
MTLGPTQSPVEWVPSPIPGDKEAGRGVAYPPSSSAEIKNKVPLLVYSSSGGSWSAMSSKLPFVSGA